MRHRFVLAPFAIALVSLSAACGGGVSAIDRGKLAHTTMTADEINIGLDGHVRAVSEGAVGGLAGGGGGCGCN